MSAWQPRWIDPTTVQEAWVLVHFRQRFLACSQNDLLFTPQDKRLQGLPIVSVQGLGYWGERAVLLYELARPVVVEHTEWQGLRQHMLSHPDPSHFQMLCLAAQVGTWVSQHQFCGSCGAGMTPVLGERAMHCPQCESSHYPRLSPCMIALVTRGDEVLLARSPHHAPGVYSTLAGFVEPGESLEQCVHREVLEEVGVQVQAPQYIASQSWPFPHSLMLGFHVVYAGGTIQPQPSEIEDARWFSIDDLPSLPSSRTIARHLIDTYIAQRRQQPLPLWPHQ